MQEAILSDLVVYRATDAARDGHGAEWFFDEMRRIDETRRAAGGRGPLRILVDLRGSTWSLDAPRRAVYARHREMAHHRVAILGESRIHEFVTTFLVAATGHKAARYFTDEAHANAWLQEAVP